MTYGFIGLGNMASAIIQGMRRSENFKECRIYGFDPDDNKLQNLSRVASLTPAASALEVARSADVIILAVKPQILPTVLAELKSVLSGGKLVITIAAGKKISWYEEILGSGTHIVRVMPNIAAKVGAACSALCKNETATEEELATAVQIFASVGTTHIIEEKLFSAFTALSGSSGAITLMYINAIATAGVEAGFNKKIALQIANEATEGACKLLREGTSHPSELIDSICSPGGTTIAGVTTAKNLGLEATTIQAIKAIIEKDKTLSK